MALLFCPIIIPRRKEGVIELLYVPPEIYQRVLEHYKYLYGTKFVHGQSKHCVCRISMRIIKKGSVEKKGICKRCGTEFMFNDEDCVGKSSEEKNITTYIVKCPLNECGQTVTMNVSSVPNPEYVEKNTFR